MGGGPREDTVFVEQLIAPRKAPMRTATYGTGDIETHQNLVKI